MLSQGHILNTCEILSVIGQGGFGIVYKGKHRELGIDVAIKEYFPSDLSVRCDGTVQPRTQEFQDPFEEGLERFLREAKQLERFRDCPNIVTCRDLFRANGTAYTIMDYVPGLSLSKLLEYRESRGEPLTEEELLDLILPLLTGLQKVHDADICHRDIKPSNILVRRDDSAPILIDFGAAKHEISKRTKSIAPYTDGYAAMEQIGEGEIGPWTDVYGLGAVMWRVVAGGNPPFSPPNPPTVQKRAFEIMQGRSDPLPSAKEVGKGRFSDKILQTIDGCLTVSVNDRIQNCSQLTEQLKFNKANIAITCSEKATDLSEVLEKEEKKPPKEEIRSSVNALRPDDTESPKKSLWKNKRLRMLNYGSIGAIILLFVGFMITRSSIYFALGGMYYDLGSGVEEDNQEAFKWFSMAAEQGHSRAQYHLGEMYYFGSGVEEDDQEALKWFSMAAEQGHSGAQYHLGGMYDFGYGVEEDNQEAFKWFSMAAEQGNSEAQHYLGEMYYFGSGVEEDDQEALKWFSMAAEQGHSEAQYYLGMMYDSGSGVEEDNQEALKWFSMAAEQGHSEAQYYLGEMYDLGSGVEEDDQEALKWFSMAAEQGHSEAQVAMMNLMGGVSGSVMFTGTPAERTPVRMNDDCTDERDTEALSEELLVNEGAVQNVFVYVSAGLPDGYTYPTPSEPAVIDQVGCMYTPRVMGVQVYQTIRIENSDPFQHNVNSGPETNRGFNESTPNVGDYLEKKFLLPEVMVPIKCDVHGWMQAYIGVLDHPYFATTDASGSFMISGLPDGNYTLTAWHEQLGEQTMEVMVSGGAMSEAAVNYQ